ncbi:MAG: VOC family protein [Pseudomonadota bacterium]
MPKDPAIKSAATIVAVSNVDASIAFYRDILGFETILATPDDSLGIVAKGPARLQLLKTDNEDALKATANNVAVYIEVDGVDDLYAHLQEGLETLPEGRLRPPFNQPYGMREFHVKDPDGCLLFFAEDA